MSISSGIYYNRIYRVKLTGSIIKEDRWIFQWIPSKVCISILTYIIYSSSEDTTLFTNKYLYLPDNFFVLKFSLSRFSYDISNIHELINHLHTTYCTVGNLHFHMFVCRHVWWKCCRDKCSIWISCRHWIVFNSCCQFIQPVATWVWFRKWLIT